LVVIFPEKVEQAIALVKQRCPKESWAWEKKNRLI
jgi:hypothetical protein